MKDANVYVKMIYFKHCDPVTYSFKYQGATVRNLFEMMLIEIISDKLFPLD